MSDPKETKRRKLDGHRTTGCASMLSRIAIVLAIVVSAPAIVAGGAGFWWGAATLCAVTASICWYLVFRGDSLPTIDEVAP